MGVERKGWKHLPQQQIVQRLLETDATVGSLATEFGCSLWTIKAIYRAHTSREERDTARARKWKVKNPNPTIPIRFVVTDSGCYECVAPKPSQNPGMHYPKTTYLGTGMHVHRAVFHVAHGFFPEVVRHRCDNPLCINADHLEPGTHEDNVADRVARERSAIGPRNGRAKLSEDQVRAIRADSRAKTTIAREFGVSLRLVDMIQKREAWRYLT